ncbi:MAG: diacylglycerol kinase family protein [Candidatus Uhrbacteria bacterium]|nr:diacylglycerol kinase family protein [Patescibacteria group bacterium]MBU1907383.1 diacylglycerol kinase family protein [Patescibacteria group bacterium]
MAHKKQNIFRSIGHAWRGVKQVFKTEQSFRIQVVFGALVIILVVLFPLEAWERVVILLLVGLVMILELINSVFERLVDSFRPRLHPVVGEIKDIMAAAVLIASVFAAIIGLIIFIPHLALYIN